MERNHLPKKLSVEGRNNIKGMKRQTQLNHINDNKTATIYHLGKLNWEIYKCITNEHVTDDIIITEEQLLHIREKHPEVYQDMLRYVREILDNPNYILRDKRPNSGLVIGKVQRETGNGTLLVLRISTPDDKDGYKNSILTGWKITKRRLENYLRNKEIIYKRE